MERSLQDHGSYHEAVSYDAAKHEQSEDHAGEDKVLLAVHSQAPPTGRTVTRAVHDDVGVGVAVAAVVR